MYSGWKNMYTQIIIDIFTKVLHRYDMNALSERKKPWWWKWTKQNRTEKNWTEKMDTGAGRISKLCKKWRRPNKKQQQPQRYMSERCIMGALRASAHRFPSSGTGVCVWLGVYYWCTICKSQLSKALECFPTAVHLLMLFSFPSRALSIVFPFYRLAFDNTLLFCHKAETSSSLGVCTVAITHLQSAIKCRIFHIEFRGFNRTIFAFYSLFFIGFLHHTRYFH